LKVCKQLVGPLPTGFGVIAEYQATVLMHVLCHVIEVQAQPIQRQLVRTSDQLVTDSRCSIDVGDLLVGSYEA
jgi:hypothetical protein